MVLEILWLVLLAAGNLVLGLLIGIKIGRKPQIRQLESLKHEARTDALTGLMNRRAFDEVLARRVGDRKRAPGLYAVEAVSQEPTRPTDAPPSSARSRRRTSPTSLLILDVDEFKLLNDRHGHLAGDDILRGVARVLNNELRESDSIARLGGDEFAVVLPATGLNAAANVAERIRTVIADQQFGTNEFPGDANVSIGVAESRPDETAESLFKRADEAVYAAKQAGRNNSCVHDGNGCEKR